MFRVGPVTITDNFIDDTLNAGQTGFSNTSLRITDEGGNNTDGVTVSGNYLIGAGFNFETADPNANTLSNVSVTNNYLGFEWYGQYFPGTENMATVSGITDVDFSNPIYSANALAAYVAALPPTANVVEGTATVAATATGSAPTTLLGNGFASAGLERDVFRLAHILHWRSSWRTRGRCRRRAARRLRRRRC